MFVQLADELESVARGAGDPIVALKRGLRAYVDFGLRHPQHYRVVFMMPAEYTDIPTDEYFKTSHGGRAFGTLVSAVERCIREGRFSTDPALASQVLWAGVHGVVALFIAHPQFPWVDRDRLIDGAIDTLVSGLERA
jgi:hypothetical protein